MTAPAKAAASATFTSAEVSKHCTPQDCWVILHGKVYDVTPFVPRHPGGAMIYVKAGGECSQLFDSYHPLSASCVLGKYLIGALAPGEVCVRYERQGASDKFYVALRQRVEAYFRDNKLHPRFSVEMYVKSALIVASLLASAYLVFFVASSYLVALVLAAVMGVAMAEVGISIQHDANHGAYCRSSWLCYLAGLSLDGICGASSFMWKQQHVVGHHAFTNVDSLDPDIHVPACRFTRWQPLARHHAFQHLYLGALYGLLAIKSILYSDFAALAAGHIGSVKLSKFAPHEVLTFWAGKAIFGAWFFAAPLMWSHWSPAQLLGLWTCALLFGGWTLTLMFVVAHVVEDVACLQQDAAGVIPGSWAAQQVATSADFAHGSWLWMHFSGGLNYQVVHHLFPGILHTHYPALAPICLEVAREHGVPYHVYPTFWAALKAHFRYLRSLGHGSFPSFVVPSLHTIG